MQDNKKNSFLGNILEFLSDRKELSENFSQYNKFQLFFNEVKAFTHKHDHEVFAVETIKCLKAIQDVCLLFPAVNPNWVEKMLNGLIDFAEKRKEVKNTHSGSIGEVLTILTDFKKILINNKNNFSSLLDSLMNEFVATYSKNKTLSEALDDFILIAQKYYGKLIDEEEFFSQFETIEKNIVDKMVLSNIAQHDLDSHRCEIFLHELHNIRENFVDTYCSHQQSVNEEKFEVLNLEADDLLEWKSEGRLNLVYQAYQRFGLSDDVLKFYDAVSLKELSEDQICKLIQKIDTDAEELERKADRHNASYQGRKQDLLNSVCELKDRIQTKKFVHDPEAVLSQMIHQFTWNYRGKTNSEIIFSFLQSIFVREFDPWFALDKINNIVERLEIECNGAVDFLIALKLHVNDYFYYLNIFREVVMLFSERFKEEKLARCLIEELKFEVDRYYDGHENLDIFCEQICAVINRFIDDSDEKLNILVGSEDAHLIMDVLSFLYDYRIKLSLLAFEKFDFVENESHKNKNASVFNNVEPARSACSSYSSVLHQFKDKKYFQVQYSVVSPQFFKEEEGLNAGCSDKKEASKRGEVSLKAQLVEIDIKGFFLSRQVNALMLKLEKEVDVKKEFKAIENQVRVIKGNFLAESLECEMKSFI